MLRSQQREFLSNLDAEAKLVASAAMLTHLLDSSAWEKAKSVGIYLADASEPNLDGVVAAGSPLGKSIAAPRIAWGTGQMEPRVVSGAHEIEIRRHGIREPLESCPLLDPAELDAVLVPGLAFDGFGGRLGRGGGYYDRFLPRLSTSCAVIGVCFAEQVVDRVPSGPHDARMDMLLTPRGLLATA